MSDKNKNNPRKRTRPIAGDYYEIEAIKDRRLSDNKLEFLVQWKGDYEDSWEPDDCLCDSAMRHAQDLFSDLTEPEGANHQDDENEASESEGETEIVEEDRDEQVYCNDTDSDEDSDEEENDEGGGTSSSPERDEDNHFSWTAELPFQEIDRFSINHPGIEDIAKQYRQSGTPFCITGHKGWAQFASRWLRPREYHSWEEDATEIQPGSNVVPGSVERLIVKSEEDPALDLSLPYELDVSAMIRDIGDEQVPILHKQYDETDPIKETSTVKQFIEKWWPNRDRPKAGSGRYLHQWLFTSSKTAVSKLCNQKIPLSIFGDDLLKFWLDSDRCGGDSPFQYLFMGNTGTMSKLHRDNGGLCITIAPIVGTKEVVLVHRDDAQTECYDLDTVCFEKINLRNLPLLHNVRMWKSAIKPGEILVLPHSTYHQCRNLTPCLSYHYFHLDTLNLFPFFKSWVNKEEVEVDTEDVIWNAATELYHRIDSFVEGLRSQPGRPRYVPAEIVKGVESLRSLLTISIEIKCHYHKQSDVKLLDYWSKLVDDIESTLHSFRYRCSDQLPPFRRRHYSTNLKPSNNVHERLQALKRAFTAAPSLSKAGPRRVIGDDVRLVTDDYVAVTLHGRCLVGQIKDIKQGMCAAMVHSELSCVYEDQFVPIDELREKKATCGTGGTIHEGMLVGRIKRGAAQLHGTVEYIQEATFYNICFGSSDKNYKFTRWLTRSFIIERRQKNVAAGQGCTKRSQIVKGKPSTSHKHLFNNQAAKRVFSSSSMVVKHNQRASKKAATASKSDRMWTAPDNVLLTPEDVAALACLPPLEHELQQQTLDVASWKNNVHDEEVQLIGVQRTPSSGEKARMTDSNDATFSPCAADTGQTTGQEVERQI